MEGLERQRPQSSSAGRDDQRHEEASREGNVGSLITAHEAGIAITGIGCRLPGKCNSPGALWSFLMDKRVAGPTTVPEDRFKLKSFFHTSPGRPGSLQCDGGFFLAEDVHDFDPTFFGISSKEAPFIDPQLRKVLEVAYEALESAGVPLESASGTNTGCFVANFTTDFSLIHARDLDFGFSQYTDTGSGTYALSNRVSHAFNLQGPSLTLDTACSSSIYALHLACQSILDGTCDSALVIGTNLLLTPERFMSIGKTGALSATSQCHSFDASADGYARAEAVSAIYIKPVKKAYEDGDAIRAVIQGSAVNSNGKSASGGITNPSARAQEAVIRKAFQRASGITPDMVGYVECHGTGTYIGDPVEVEAIGNVFIESRSLENPLLMGSIKSSMGHSEAASGLTSIIKCVLALESGIIPPVAGFHSPNPNIDFKDGRLKVANRASIWATDAGSGLRYAGVNSFGIGGTNGHVILSSYNSNTHQRNLKIPPSLKKFLLVFSAKSPESVKSNISELGRLPNHLSLPDLSYTLSARRSRFEHRAFAVVQESGQPLEEQLLERHLAFGSAPKTAPSLGFVFTGQGAQWAQMGSGLLSRFPIALETIRRLDGVLQTLDIRDRPTWTLEEAIRAPKDKSGMDSAVYSQSLTTAVQIVILRILSQWGVTPIATVGHSSGEIAAAYASGLLSMDNAIRVAYYRGLVISQNSRDGAMLAVGMGGDSIQPYLEFYEGRVVVACFNSPKSVTLSGDSPEIEMLQNTLSSQNIFVRKLRTGRNAYHSHHMAALALRYQMALEDSLEASFCQKPGGFGPPMFSSVRGSQITENSLEPRYWRENLEMPVLFKTALEALFNSTEVDTLIEIGPHSALASPVRDSAEATLAKVEYLPTLVRGQDSVQNLFCLAGALFLRNYPIDLPQVNRIDAPEDSKSERVVIGLPPYQWNYTEKYWTESRLSKEVRFREYPRHELLGSRVAGCDRHRPVWRNVLRITDLPWLSDHRVEGLAVLPAMAFPLMAAEAAIQMQSKTRQFSQQPGNGFIVQDFVIANPVVISDNDDAAQGVEVLTSMWFATVNNQVTSEKWAMFEVNSCKGGDWYNNCRGRIRLLSEAAPNAIPQAPTCSWQDASISAPPRRWYQKFAELGLEYGTSFTRVFDVKANYGEKYALTKAPISPSHGLDAREYFIHPSTLDVLVHPAFIAAFGGEVDNMDKVFLPVSLEKLSFRVPEVPSEILSIHTRAAFTSLRALDTSWRAVTEDSSTVVAVENMRLLAMNRPASLKGENETPFLRMVWKPDITQISSERAQKLLGPTSTSQRWEILNTLCLLCLQQTVPRIKKVSSKWHLQRFWNWMQHQVLSCNGIKETIAARGGDSELKIRARINHLFDILGKEDAEVRALRKLYHSYPALLAGEIDGLQSLLGDSLLDEIYRNGMRTRLASINLAKAIDLIGHKTPNMRILEIGAGTGGTTERVLSALDGDTPFKRYAEYVFTDLSSGFLPAAKEKFASCHGMTYDTLDIEQDPMSQNYEPYSFDVVLAANCFHATQNVEETLRHVHRLLKPDGHLLLLEVTQDTFEATMLYGTLESYWRRVQFSDTLRNPFLSKSEWLEAFKATGFSSEPIMLDDEKGSPEPTTVFVLKPASLDPPSTTVTGGQRLGVLYWKTPHPLADYICRRANTRGIPSELISISQYRLLSQKPTDIVSLLDLEGQSFLSELDADGLAVLQQIVNECQSVIWLCPGGIQCEDSPKHGLVYGWARAMAFESSLSYFATVSVNPGAVSQPEFVCSHVLKTLSQVGRETRGHEREMALINDVCYIPRATAHEDLNRLVKQELTSSIMDVPYAAEKPLEVALSRPGVLETVHFKEDAGYYEPLSPTDVEIKVQAAGMIFKGLTVILGWHDDNSLCWECSGTITRVGKDVTRVAPGDRVVALCASRFNRYVRVNQLLVETLQPDEDLEEMATMPVSFVTAIHSIHQLARLQKGEKILIQSAGGGLGTAAIELAKLVGAEIYATVGGSNNLKRESLQTRFGIPQDHIFDSSGTGFVDDVLRATSGQGVDVILGTASGEGLQESFRCLRHFGRFIELGGKELINHGQFDLHSLRRNISFHAVDLSIMLYEGPELAGVLNSYLKQMLQLYRERKISPITPTKSFHITDIASSVRSFQQREGGKIILTFGPPESERIVQVLKSPDRFPSNASYLMIGCLGGLGRSLSSFMARHGARSFVFLSRSGETTSEAKALCADLRKTGVDVVVARGDVTVAADVQAAVEQAPFPIKGIVQSAMVLRDKLFDAMDLSDLNATLQPKVQGTLNIHSAVAGQPLDFFLMLSSVCGYLGHTGQSNYAAANTFMDSFARYRRKNGLPATSLALGIVEGVGYTAEHPEVTSALERYGATKLDEAEFLRVFKQIVFPREAHTASPDGDVAYKDEFSDSYLVSGLDPSKFKSSTSWVESSMGPDPRSSIWDNALKHFQQSGHEQDELGHRSQQSTEDVAQLLLAGRPEGYSLLVAAIKQRLSTLLAISVDEIEDDHLLSTYGFDSMIGAELRAWVSACFRVQLAFLEMTGPDGTVKRIADKIGSRLTSI